MNKKQNKVTYKGFPVNGPYFRKSDGRLYVTIRGPGRKHTTVSYPKFLMEQRLGRYLKDNETVDHIDGNPLNNHWKNLRILDNRTHAKLDSSRYAPMNFVCPQCGAKFIKEGRSLQCVLAERKREKAGPFCSKTCSGKYGVEVRLGKQNKLVVNKYVPHTYTLKSLEHK